MAEIYLTVEQVALRLQLHPFTIRRQLQSGRLRGIKRGRVWRVPESAIEESSPEPNDNAPKQNVPQRSDLQDSALQERIASASSPAAIKRDVNLLDKVRQLAAKQPNRRAKAGLPPLTDEQIFEALYDNE